MFLQRIYGAGVRDAWELLVKSDVFSFGVLLLEILSGKRNSGFHQHEDFLNLLGYVSILQTLTHICTLFVNRSNF